MNYVYDPNELYHFGIKGQKWGVRRYQNADGTLTPKGQKHLAKMDGYKNKLATKADKKAKRYSANAKQAMDNVADLKKNGQNSKAYKDWKESADRRRAYEYEKKNSVIVDGSVYKKSYAKSGSKLFNDIMDSAVANVKINELIDTNNSNAAYYKDRAKRWTNANQKLMNTTVSTLTTKRDIKKIYKGK